MAVGVTYTSRESALAQAIVDEMIARGVGLGGSNGGSSGGDANAANQLEEINKLVEIRDRLLLPSLYEQVINSSDLYKAIGYFDAGTADERISTIIITSLSLNIEFYDNYIYDGISGNYRVVAVTRTFAAPGPSN